VVQGFLAELTVIDVRCATPNVGAHQRRVRYRRLVGGSGVMIGRGEVFTSKIRSSPGPAKISHSRGVPWASSPCKISLQCHVEMIFIFPLLTIAFVLIGAPSRSFSSVNAITLCVESRQNVR
jgi:hypothetical protein